LMLTEWIDGVSLEKLPENEIQVDWMETCGRLQGRLHETTLKDRKSKRLHGNIPPFRAPSKGPVERR